MSEFVHLHAHSHYSLLDGLPKIKDLVKTAKKRGFSALALTDHGNMYGAIEFYQACLKEGIKPIIGVEAYIAPKSRFDKDKDNRYYHLILLAQNYEGYRNLMKLTSIAHLEGFYYKPRIDKEVLRQYSAGLIASSACLQGEIPRALMADNFSRAKEAAQEYIDIFGQDNFYLEMMDLPALNEQMGLNQSLMELSRQTGLGLIVTRDVHYLDPKDDEAQDIMTCIRDGRTIDEPNRRTMVGVDYSLAEGALIAGRFKHVPEAIANTAKIAERINLKLELNKWHFPDVELPAGVPVEKYLRDQVYDKLSKLMEITDNVKKRVEYELDIISTKGYCPYFIAVADFVGYARVNGIVETTRGSGAGSIVSYALGITTVNPLDFKLPFERFLNPFRPSPPDIDTDFADDRRDDMIAYVTKKYGQDKVAQIITFGTMMARGSVRDVGRALGYSYSFCDQVAKLIPFGAQGFQMTIAKALELEPELKKLYKENEQVSRLLDLAQKIEGCCRHTSMHAAGVVIAPTPLTDFTPIQYETGGERITTQYEMHSVEAAGVLKFDFLGIRNLSILGRAVEIVAKTTGQEIDIYNLPMDDKKTYEMLSRGETMSVFQLSSSGMTRYLKELKPTNIFDIMAMVALFRPGPMESIPEYIRRKNDPKAIEYLDERMKDYLDQSLGLIVYQDDVLLTAINLAGYNWEEADKFRKAMGKKIPAEMEKQKIKFFQGCRDYGQLPENKINYLWELIEPFAAYGFNKAHAASYGVVAYQTAYLKANFPIQYMTAVLIAESGDIDKVPQIIHECERMGIKVLPPSVNHSFKNFAMVEPKDGQPAHIRFGLNAIKNVGEHIAEVIYRERKNNGQYKNLEDLLQRIKDKDLNKKSLESLAKCGAMDCFGYDRGLLLGNTENIINFIKLTHEQATSNQGSLFANTKIDMNNRLRLEPASQAQENDILNWERELLGLYVSSHPFAFFQKNMACLAPLGELNLRERSRWVVVGGVIMSAKKKITRSGKAMMFVSLQDTTGNLELLVFPKIYETTKDIWQEGAIVCVEGRTSEEEGDDKLFVEKVFDLTPANYQELDSRLKGFSSSDPNFAFNNKIEPTGVCLALDRQEVKDKGEKIKDILKKYPGEDIFYLLVDNKKIKTSFKIKPDDGLRQEFVELMGSDRLNKN
ncbi:MAG: DNA polymerase III subunit alpha [Candidatus Magasanikbacteria bacterium CG10_big_fil_rev_8_21_14_0_10_40_10]|uniref:DNA polymerase III subunit alpha n=1 Tax=Candidatus Magasanikbacteria bacterium CG10_big_fil_rev_8_21_14_0_10_40_10 TaxID=1974648 RepID=A0A2M6W4E0_9BACT|nr:MAG: DNA polymerase III subunit alpha [Candidatus Magasanikbacteria bacterium CG10_big_fil_rev_8_21_14_0_10_40_10]